MVGFRRHPGGSPRPEGVKRHPFHTLGLLTYGLIALVILLTIRIIREPGPAQNADRKLDIGCEE